MGRLQTGRVIMRSGRITQSTNLASSWKGLLTIVSANGKTIYQARQFNNGHPRSDELDYHGEMVPPGTGATGMQYDFHMPMTHSSAALHKKVDMEGEGRSINIKPPYLL